jgi:hypothetical protein
MPVVDALDRLLGPDPLLESDFTRRGRDCREPEQGEQGRENVPARWGVNHGSASYRVN